jgi:hypothetical protein
MVLSYVINAWANSFCVSVRKVATELRRRKCSTVARYLEGAEREPQPKDRRPD